MTARLADATLFSSFNCSLSPMSGVRTTDLLRDLLKGTSARIRKDGPEFSGSLLMNRFCRFPT